MRISAVAPEIDCPQRDVQSLDDWRTSSLRARQSDRRAAGRFAMILMVCVLSWNTGFGVSTGQQTSRLIDQEPFDRIVLNQENQGQVLIALPLDLPNRVVPPEFPRTGSIRARLTTNPEEELEISWSGIERIELFEDAVLKEARKLATEKRFDDAFEELAYLRDRFPKTAGLDELTDVLMYAEATSLYQAKQVERAWILLDEIYRRSPERKGVATALRRVLDAIFQAEMNDKNYAHARQRYQLARERYAQALPDLLESWKKQLSDIATTKKQETQSHLERGELREAYLASVTMLNAWPELQDAKELARQVSLRYPLVRVGVEELVGTRLTGPKDSMVDWAARRTRRLRERHLAEPTGVGPDGTIYQSPIGKLQLADDFRSLSLQLNDKIASHLSASLVGLRLVSMAHEDDPQTQEAWRAGIERIDVQGLDTILARFRRPQLRPESLIDVPMMEDKQAFLQPYEAMEPQEGEQVFRLAASYLLATETQPREIIERTFESPQQAIQALRRGELDLVDRLFPGDVALLQKDPNLNVVAYRSATLHCLVANRRRDFPSNRLFRKAVLYGIDRERILKRDLLGGIDLPGCRVLSGPFPAGITEDDPLGYAYNSRIEPRAYDPRHARTLLQLAQIELEASAKKRKVEPPALGELVFFHPKNELARVACQEIVRDLQVMGLSCRLQAIDGGIPAGEEDTWDFRYVDLFMPEPLMGASQLLSADGIAGGSSPHVQLALRQLEQVTNWNDAGERLRVIHQLVHDDTSVLPLWQMVEHLAHRKELQSVVAQPLTTYQDVEAWRVTGGP